MCGRYSLVCIDDLGNRFRVHNPMIGSRSHFNIRPGNEMPVIVRNQVDEVVMMHWGLVPHRAKDLASAPKPINARAESLSEKPMFCRLLEHGRCLVPASGFYEWKKEGTRKIPFYFHLPENPIFAFAGLYDLRENPEGTRLGSYTIITCVPNDLVACVHNRMPVILSRANEERWLSRESLTPQDLRRILSPSPSSCMERVPVADLVNNPALDDERLVVPLDSSSSTQTFLTD
jgi:putative SOS response-associated peptidase YedK